MRLYVESIPNLVIQPSCEYKGVKYLKSENTGVIYNMDEDVVGKWNEKTKGIDFHDVEEEEEEYDEE